MHRCRPPWSLSSPQPTCMYTYLSPSNTPLSPIFPIHIHTLVSLTRPQNMPTHELTKSLQQEKRRLAHTKPRRQPQPHPPRVPTYPLNRASYICRYNTYLTLPHVGTPHTSERREEKSPAAREITPPSSTYPTAILHTLGIL